MLRVTTTGEEQAKGILPRVESAQTDAPTPDVLRQIAPIADRLPRAPARFMEPFVEQRHRTVEDRCVEHHTGGILASPKRQRDLEAQWERLTGRNPEESRFTLIVPVHNEARLLPGTLYCLSRSNVPSSVPVQVVFVTNGSTDESAAIIQRRLGRLYHFGNTRVPSFLRDIDARVTLATASFGDLSMYHVVTPTPGKANALNIGDRFARNRGDGICMCIDADSFVEPNTIRRLYADAVKHRVGEPDSDVVAVAGAVQFAVSREAAKAGAFVQQRIGRVTEKISPPREGHIFGSVWAWSTGWLEAQGGHPTSVIEDTATAARAFLDGKRVAQSSAVTWALAPLTLSDYGREQARMARGIHQLRAEVGKTRFSELKELLGDSYWYGSSSVGRALHLLLPKILHTNPMRWPRTVVRFVVDEYWRQQGIRQFKNDPAAATWEPVATTKS